MKKIFILIVALVLVGSFLMSLMTTTEGDLLAAVIVLVGAATGTIYTLKKAKTPPNNLGNLLAVNSNSEHQAKRLKLYLIPL